TGCEFDGEYARIALDRSPKGLCYHLIGPGGHGMNPQRHRLKLRATHAELALRGPRIDDDEVGALLRRRHRDLRAGHGDRPRLWVPSAHRFYRGERRHNSATVWCRERNDR